MSPSDRIVVRPATAADRKYRFLTLNVFSDNTRARTAYERAGYEPDVVRYLKEL